MTLRYAPTCANLAIRRLGQEVLVFNPASGSTHLLSDAALEVLRGLLEATSPTDSSMLCLTLLGDASADELPNMDSMLREFVRLGLAEVQSS